MAKKYVLRNTTYDPARPIGLMTGGAKAGSSSNPKAFVMIAPDEELPETLTQEQYDYAKIAITRYVSARSLSLEVIGEDDPAKDNLDEFDWENSEDEEDLIEYAESKGIECDARATVNSVKKKLKALEA